VIDIDDPDLGILARRLNARAEVQDVRLLKSSVEMLQLPSESNSLVYDLNSFPEIQYSAGASFFVVEISYTLVIDEVSDDSAIEPAGEDSERTPSIARAEFTLAALFTVVMRDADEPPSDQELEAYSSTTAQLMLYPYAREYIYDLTGRLGLPSLSIGMLKMTASSGREPDKPSAEQ
jgi:hypothetical protein